ncbi:MAG TPA: hypothetical protein VFK13_07545 [Gemmatimonadaceae bacterium]|nr:hypothetical protein [Gemmatimonadaceae bacterium]
MTTPAPATLLPAPRPAPLALPRVASPSASTHGGTTRGDGAAPSPDDRLRILESAYDSSVNDAEQRFLIREIIGHYRAWCAAHGVALAARERRS